MRITKFLAAAALLLIPVGLPAVTTNIIYTDGAGEGFNDPTVVGDTTLGELRKDVLEYAVEYLASRIDGTSSINIQAEFNNLGGDAGSAVLASAGPIAFALLPTQGPRPNTYYPISLAKQLVTIGNPPTYDIFIQFNTDIDNATVLGASDWYYGADEDAGSDISMIRTALHELSHGLGFTDSIDKDTGEYEIGAGTDPSIYDTFLREGSGPGVALTSMTNANRLGALTSDNLYWEAGTNTTTANGGSQPPMYAPSPYEPGSSVSHFDFMQFTPQELMEPILLTDFVTVGLTDQALQDMGYTLLGPTNFPELSFSSYPSIITEDDGAQTYEVSLAGSTTQPVTALVQLSGDAVEGVDYTISTQQITITPPATSAQFTIDPSPDGVDEGAVGTGGESIQLKLVRIVNAEFGSTTNVVTEIQDTESTMIPDWMIF